MVEILDLNARTTAAAAKKKAQAFIRELKSIKPDKTQVRYTKMYDTAGDVVRALGRPMAPDARGAFIYHLGEPFKGSSMFMAVSKEWQSWTAATTIDQRPVEVTSPGSLAALHWVNDGKDYRKWGGELWRPTNGLVVIPTCEPWVESGVSCTYSMQAMQETSKSKGAESYIDVYVQADASAKIPLGGVLSIDVKAGVKRGRKEYVKRESKEAVRRGPNMSKTFILQNIGRDCVIWTRRSHARMELLTVQSGYQLLPREGGDIIGPFWPWLRVDGSEVPNTAFFAAGQALETALDDAAVEIARQFSLLN